MVRPVDTERVGRFLIRLGVGLLLGAGFLGIVEGLW